MRLVEAVFWGKISMRFIVLVFFLLIVVGFVMSQFKQEVPLTTVFIADKKCGTLPTLDLPKLNIDYSSADINLVVQEELYKDIPPIAYVYKVNLQGETFTTKQKAFNIAEKFKFIPNRYTKPKSTIYKWQDTRRTLIFNTSNLNFYYTLLPQALPPIPNPDIPPLVTAKQLAIQAYNSIDNAGKTKIYTFMVDLLPNGKDLEVDSLELARAIRVDFQRNVVVLRYPTLLLDSKYREKHKGEIVDFLQYYNLSKIDGVASYDANTVAEAPFLGGSQVYVVSQYGNGLENVGRFRFSNWKLEDKPCGTYNIITARDAFALVQDKKVPVSYMYLWGGDRLKPITTGVIKKLTITNIYLAYYQPQKQLPFLQPIYVVEGDGYLNSGERVGVFFYINAIKK